MMQKILLIMLIFFLVGITASSDDLLANDHIDKHLNSTK